MFKNAPTGWKVNSTKNVYTNDLIELYEDTLELGVGAKKFTFEDLEGTIQL